MATTKSSEAVVPNLDWYSGKSATAKLSPRCPIARSELCPRYYASLWLLGQAGVTTKIKEADQVRLDKKWEPFKSVVAEEEASVIQRDGEFRAVLQFCPEVSYQVFGLFAAGLHEYSDEIDRDAAHARLRSAGAQHGDPAWTWAVVVPRHYTECREYSIFTSATTGARSRQQRQSRMGVAPRVRWLVFSRDNFTCKYCGRRPPEAILEVDHVISVLAGGGDEIENLVTSCLECNRGKSGDCASPVAPLTGAQ